MAEIPAGHGAVPVARLSELLECEAALARVRMLCDGLRATEGLKAAVSVTTVQDALKRFGDGAWSYDLAREASDSLTRQFDDCQQCGAPVIIAEAVNGPVRMVVFLDPEPAQLKVTCELPEIPSQEVNVIVDSVSPGQGKYLVLLTADIARVQEYGLTAITWHKEWYIKFAGRLFWSHEVSCRNTPHGFHTPEHRHG